MRHLPPSPRRVVLAAAAVLAACATGGAQPDDGIVYYQIVTADNRIRDVAEVPRTNQGIRGVVRISRIEGAYPGHVVHTINAAGFELVHTGRTARTSLRWDGEAWVAPSEARAAPDTPATTQPAGTQPAQADRRQRRQQAARLLAEKIRTAKEALDVAEKAVLAAAEGLAAAKGTDKQAPARLLLTGAEQARRKALRELVQLEGLRADVEAPPPAPEAGQPVPGEIDPDAEGALGVGRPVRSRRLLPYRTHVWRLPHATGRRTYSVSMAHPEAGYYGAFRYVAYADTTGDGRPDTLIARSLLAVAQRPGQWTRWNFTTDYPGGVYVGSAWPYARAASYYQPAPTASVAVRNWEGLGTEVYVSGSPLGAPSRRWGRPYTTNLRVRRRRGR